MHKGSCLCGAVTFTIDARLTEAIACHCSQCRKQTGHFLADCEVKRDDLTVSGAENVTWYRSSEKVRRGFCATCGSVLFWDPVVETDWTGVAMGALDAPTGIRLTRHIFTADKGDYYRIPDNEPQEEFPPC